MAKFVLDTYTVGDPEWKSLFDQISLFLSKSEFAQLDGNVVAYSTATSATSFSVNHSLGYTPTVAFLIGWSASTTSYVGFSINLKEADTSKLIVRSSVSVAPTLALFVGRRGI
jgi:hypothetical protein